MTTLDEVRAEALFVCGLQPSQHPAPEQVRRAVLWTLRRYSSRSCAARMAQEFGEHPEAAAHRMAWALQVVRDCFAPPGPVSPTRCRATGGSASWTLTDPSIVWRDYGEAPRCPCPVGRRRRPWS